MIAIALLSVSLADARRLNLEKREFVLTSSGPTKWDAFQFPSESACQGSSSDPLYTPVNDGETLAGHSFRLDAFDDSHGRLVRRRVFACPDVGVFATLADWPGLRAVLAVETIRGIPGRGKVTAEIRHYLSSAALPPEALAVAIRNHWRVENGLHWVLDVTFREDASRVRERNAARNLALLRKVALNLVRADGSLKASLRGKRKYAGWDDAFMATLIAG